MTKHRGRAPREIKRRANATGTCHSRHHRQETMKRSVGRVTGRPGRCHASPSLMHSRAFANELRELVGEWKDALALGAGSVVLQTDPGEPLSKNTGIERA